MDHLSTMKRKNVVLVYNLLLEMLEANVSGSQPSSSPTSESVSDRYRYPEPPAPPGQDQGVGHAPAPPGDAPDPQAPPLQCSSPFQSLLVAHVDDGYEREPPPRLGPVWRRALVRSGRFV